MCVLARCHRVSDKGGGQIGAFVMTMYFPVLPLPLHRPECYRCDRSIQTLALNRISPMVNDPAAARAPLSLSSGPFDCHGPVNTPLSDRSTIVSLLLSGLDHQTCRERVSSIRLVLCHLSLPPPPVGLNCSKTQLEKTQLQRKGKKKTRSARNDIFPRRRHGQQDVSG